MDNDTIRARERSRFWENIGAGALIDFLISNPIVQELEQKARASASSARSKIGERIAALREARSKELPALEARTKEAERHLASLIPSYRSAAEAVQRAQGKQAWTRQNYDGQISRLESELVQTSSPVVEECVRRMAGMLDEHRRKLAVWNELHRKRSADGKRDWVTFSTNAPAAEARRVAILEGLRLVQTWRADPNQDDLEERFAALVAALPDDRVFTEVEIS